MKGNMEQRACDEAVYIIESRGTVRDAAKIRYQQIYGA